jgi:hypothetical protein
VHSDKDCEYLVSRFNLQGGRYSGAACWPAAEPLEDSFLIDSQILRSMKALDEGSALRDWPSEDYLESEG